MTDNFVDSNICVYNFDKSDPRKQQIAFSLLDRIPVISSQVLIETYNACFRKLKLDAASCEENISILLATAHLLNMNEKIFRNGFLLQRRYGFSFLDT